MRGRPAALFSASLLTAALLLSACSGKQAPPGPTSTPLQHGALAGCLRSHGVVESSGPAAVLGPPAGVDPAQWEQAMKACSTLAPGPGAP